MIHDLLLSSCTFGVCWESSCVIWIGPCVHTYSELAGFSEKTLSVKSASFCGSNVEGTMMYSPAGSRKRELTSRRLMKSSERALDALDRKKSRFRWTPDFPTDWAQTHGGSFNKSEREICVQTLFFKSILHLQNSDCICQSHICCQGVDMWLLRCSGLWCCVWLLRCSDLCCCYGVVCGCYGVLIYGVVFGC